MARAGDFDRAPRDVRNADRCPAYLPAPRDPAVATGEREVFDLRRLVFLASRPERRM